MGLDMYAFKIKNPTSLPQVIMSDKTDPLEKNISKKEIGHWRNYHELHDFIEEIFNTKCEDSANSNFNCDYLELTSEDINSIESFLLEELLLKTPQAIRKKQATMNFITAARDAISLEYQVYYYAWY